MMNRETMEQICLQVKELWDAKVPEEEILDKISKSTGMPKEFVKGALDMWEYISEECPEGWCLVHG